MLLSMIPSRGFIKLVAARRHGLQVQISLTISALLLLIMTFSLLGSRVIMRGYFQSPLFLAHFEHVISTKQIKLS